jgi:ABC-type proline/glycine betaine transport system ATPase subunit
MNQHNHRDDTESLAELSVRSLEWERLMQIAVSRAIDEHRRAGHPIAVMRDGKVVTLTADEY